MSLDDLGGSKVASEPKKQYIKLLTFNTWGLKFISKHRKERLRAIADALANPKALMKTMTLLLYKRFGVKRTGSI